MPTQPIPSTAPTLAITRSRSSPRSSGTNRRLASTMARNMDTPRCFPAGAMQLWDRAAREVYLRVRKARILPPPDRCRRAFRLEPARGIAKPLSCETRSCPGAITLTPRRRLSTPAFASADRAEKVDRGDAGQARCGATTASPDGRWVAFQLTETEAGILQAIDRPVARRPRRQMPTRRRCRLPWARKARAAPAFGKGRHPRFLSRHFRTNRWRKNPVQQVPRRRCRSRARCFRLHSPDRGQLTRLGRYSQGMPTLAATPRPEKALRWR